MTSSSIGVIRRAVPGESDLLNALTGRSVLHWGYEPEFLDWEPEAITVTPEWIAEFPVFVLEEAGRIVGYYGLLGQPPRMSLDKLFVDADRIGTGCGKRLWLHAIETARDLGAETLVLASDPNAAPFYRDLGAETLVLASDPNAAPFYRAMGAEWTGEEATSRPGWSLQMFRFPVPPHDIGRDP